VVPRKDLGSGVIGGAECDYLAFRTKDVDWQIWVAQGARPHPCRYVITSKRVTNEPQYSIQLRNWQTGDEVAAVDFDFKAPAGARQIQLDELKAMKNMGSRRSGDELQCRFPRACVSRGRCLIPLFMIDEQRVAIEYLPPMALEKLHRVLAAMPAGSIIYFASFFEDDTGGKFIPMDVLAELSRVANAPMYCWPEMTLGLGIVGSELLSEQAVARQMAAVALRVLRGESPDSIPKLEIRPYVRAFDERQLRRWRISEAGCRRAASSSQGTARCCSTRNLEPAQR
jgi:hypothetical protein